MKPICAIAKALKITFFIFIALILTFIVVLFYGLSIDHIELLNFQAEKLYIKLENKLILNAKSIAYKSPLNSSAITSDYSEQFSIKNLKKLNDIKSIFKVFEEISIEQLKIDNKEFCAKFDSNWLQIIGKDFELKVSANTQESSPFLLNYGPLKLTGDLLIADSSILKGKLTFVNSSADIFIVKTNKFTNILASNIFIDDSKTLAPYFASLPPVLNSWIFERSSLINATGVFSMKLVSRSSKILDYSASIKAQKLSNQFHPNLDAAVADNAQINIKNHILKISSNNVQLKSIKANKFNLEIPLKPHPNIEINLDSNSLLNQDLLKVLKAYKINLPLQQLNGNNNTHLNILLRAQTTPLVTLNSTSSGTYEFANTPFSAKMKIDFNNSRADMLLINADANSRFISAPNTTVKFNNKFILNIDSADFQIISPYFNYSSPFALSFDTKSKRLESNFYNLNGSIDGANSSLQISPKILSSIALLKPLNIQSDEINILINNLKTKIILNASYETPKKVEDKFTINISPNLSLESQHIKYANNHLQLSDLEVDLSLFPDSASKLPTSQKASKLSIALDNCTFIYKQFKLHLDKANLLIDGNNFSIESADKNLSFIKNQTGIKAHIYHLKSKDFNALVGEELLNGGEVAAVIEGKSMDEFSGIINIINAELARTKSYLNLVKFLDSLGSLITFSASKQAGGLGIKLGSIEFSKRNNALVFDQIQMLGKHLDVAGNGSYDIGSGYLLLNLNLFTLKNTSKAIKNIPLVNKILLGGNKSSIATSLKISGQLNDLKYQTSVARDFLTTPFRLIENVIKLPKNLLIN